MPLATRRDFLGLAVAGGAVLATRSAGAAPASLDLDSPAGRLKAYMLMRGALDERIVIGFIVARYFGVIDAEMTPLFGVVAATIARYRPVTGGGYEAASYEVPYFTDLDTGKVIDHWHNPYTGEDVAVPNSALPPAMLAISADLKLTVPALPPGMTLTNHILPPRITENDVWIVEESNSQFLPPGAAKPFHYNEIVTMHARRSDLEHENAVRVPCQTSYTGITSWRPWMKMGDRPGSLIADGAGRYDIPLKAMPAAWLEAVEAKRPEVLHDPASPIAALWNKKL